MKPVASMNRLPDADLCEAVTLAARRMLLDAKLNKKIQYLSNVLPDQQDVQDALAFLDREANRLVRWTQD